MKILTDLVLLGLYFHIVYGIKCYKCRDNDGPVHISNSKCLNNSKSEIVDCEDQCVLEGLLFHYYVEKNDEHNYHKYMINRGCETFYKNDFCYSELAQNVFGNDIYPKSFQRKIYRKYSPCKGDLCNNHKFEFTFSKSEFTKSELKCDNVSLANFKFIPKKVTNSTANTLITTKTTAYVWLAVLNSTKFKALQNNTGNSTEFTKAKRKSTKVEQETTKIDRETTKSNQEFTMVDQGSTKIDRESMTVERKPTKVDLVLTKADREFTKADRGSTKIDRESTKPDRESTKADRELTKVARESTKVDRSSTKSGHHSTKIENTKTTTDSFGMKISLQERKRPYGLAEGPTIPMELPLNEIFDERALKHNFEDASHIFGDGNLTFRKSIEIDYFPKQPEIAKTKSFAKKLRIISKPLIFSSIIFVLLSKVS